MLGGSPGSSAAEHGVIETVATAYDHAVLFEDSSFLAEDYMADLAVEISRVWTQTKTRRAWSQVWCSPQQLERRGLLARRAGPSWITVECFGRFVVTRP